MWVVDATLNGRLELVPAPGYTPTAGAVQRLIHGLWNPGSRFSSVTGLTISPGLRWVLDYPQPGQQDGILVARAETVGVGVPPGPAPVANAAPAVTPRADVVRAVDDRYTGTAGRRVHVPAVRGLLANDASLPGMRIRVVWRNHAARAVKVDTRTGALRYRVPARTPARLRYRLEIAGRRSVIATVTIRSR
jgi:hypothetical protein